MPSLKCLYLIANKKLMNLFPVTSTWGNAIKNAQTQHSLTPKPIRTNPHHRHNTQSINYWSGKINICTISWAFAGVWISNSVTPIQCWNMCWWLNSCQKLPFIVRIRRDVHSHTHTPIRIVHLSILLDFNCKVNFKIHDSILWYEIHRNS